jgi:hypothetical protein
MKNIECKELIVATLSRRGTGKEHSPIRTITEVYEKDGTKIAEHDPAPETFVQMDLLHFARWIKHKGFDPDKLDIKAVVKWLDYVNE